MKAEKTFVAVAGGIVLVLAAGALILGPAAFAAALGTYAVPVFAGTILLFGIVTVINPHPRLVSGGPLAGRLSGLFNIALGLTFISDLIFTRHDIDANIALLVRIATLAFLVCALTALLIVQRRISTKKITAPTRTPTARA